MAKRNKQSPTVSIRAIDGSIFDDEETMATLQRCFGLDEDAVRELVGAAERHGVEAEGHGVKRKKPRAR